METGKIGRGPFVAFSTNIGVPSYGIHWRIIMVDVRDRLRPVTLPTGDPGPGRVEVPCLSWVAIDTGVPLVEFESPMGVRKTAAQPDFRRGRSVRKEASLDSGNLHPGAHAPWAHFISFIITGRHTLTIAVDIRSDLLLGPGRFWIGPLEQDQRDQGRESPPQICTTTNIHRVTYEPL